MPEVYLRNPKKVIQSTNKAVAYIRVSDESQIHGESLNTQREIITAAALRDGVEIVRWFIEEGYSAKTANRPALNEMLAFCAQNKGKVSYAYFYKLQRASRDAPSYYSSIRGFLLGVGVKVRSATEPIDDTKEGRFLETIFVATAQLDNETKSETTLDNMKRIARQGWWQHGAILGYDTKKVKLAPKKYRPSLKPNDRLPLVRQLLLKFNEGKYTQADLVRLAKDVGLKTNTGLYLNQNAVYRLVTQPAYAGYVCSKLTDNELCEAQFEGVITLEQFWQNQKFLDKNQLKRSGIKYAANNSLYPLKRFVLCHNCSLPLYASAPKTGGGSHSPRYHCARATCKGLTKSVRADVVHDKFYDILKTVQPTEGTLRLYKEVLRRTGEKQLGQTNKQIEAMHTRLDAIANERLEALKKCNSGLLSVAEKDDLLAAYSAEKLELMQELKSLEENQTVQEAQMNYVLNFMTDVAKQWLDADLDIQQEFQNLVFPEGAVFNTMTSEFGTMNVSPLYRYAPNKKDLSESEKSLMVTLVTKSLHPLKEEAQRWRTIVGGPYEQYQLQVKQSDRLHPVQGIHLSK